MTGADEHKRLMKLRKRMSQRRPKFAQFESWRFVRIKDHWRQPKGIDNHMKQNRKGWPKSVNVGYRSPKAVRGLHPSGREEVAVYNVGDLAIVDPETQVARIGGAVGKRKRNIIVAEAENRGIKILNPGEAQPIPDLEEAEEEVSETEVDEVLDEPEDAVGEIEEDAVEPEDEEEAPESEGEEEEP